MRRRSEFEQLPPRPSWRWRNGSSACEIVRGCAWSPEIDGLGGVMEGNKSETYNSDSMNKVKSFIGILRLFLRLYWLRPCGALCYERAGRADIDKPGRSVLTSGRTAAASPRGSSPTRSTAHNRFHLRTKPVRRTNATDKDKDEESRSRRASGRTLTRVDEILEFGQQADWVSDQRRK